MSGWLKKVAAKLAALGNLCGLSFRFVFNRRLIIIDFLSSFFGWILINPLYFPALVIFCGFQKSGLAVLLVSVSMKSVSILSTLSRDDWKTILTKTFRDIAVGAKILPRMWDLYLQIVAVSTANYILWINSITRMDTIWTNPLIVITSILGWNATLIVAGIFAYEFFQFFTNGKDETGNGDEAAYFLIYFYSVGMVSRLMDGIILWVIIFHGFFLSVAICTPIFFFICVHWLKIYQRFQDKGIDLQKIVYLRSLRLKPKKSCGEKITAWILKRKATIFLFGSAFVLDPDLVTLLLRKKSHFTWRECFKITLPSAAQCILVWAIIYQLGVWGIKYFRWLVD